MKTRLLIIIGLVGISMIVISLLMIVSFSLYGDGNFLELGLPHTEYGTIDYVKIGYDASLNDFKSKLGEKNIQYTSNELTFISGMSLTSDPPHTDYCGYVVTDNDDYWYQSSFHKDTLSRNEITDENPMPCKPNVMSCICLLEEKLAKINNEN